LAGLLFLGLGGCPTNVTNTAGASAINGVPGEFPDCRIPAQEDAWAAEVLALVNQERTGRGLCALQASSELAQAANEQACAMIHYNFFDHTNPVTGDTPTERFIACGFQGDIYGENLAAGPTTPEQVVEGWMNSPGHRHNILLPEFTHLGVGVRLGGQYAVYWVQVFAAADTGK
jgi:uncharacterized protein YkwD